MALGPLARPRTLFSIALILILFYAVWRDQSRPQETASAARACAKHLVSAESRWRARVTRRRNASLNPYEHLNPVPEPYYNDPGAWHQRIAYDLFEPEWSCAPEERVGVPYGDGGKWACAFPPTEDCLVYSVGSNYDFSFENAVKAANPHCEVHTFDPTTDPERSIALAIKAGATFHSLGIGDAPEGSPGKGVSLRTLVDLLGHSNRTISILKADCEYCEYSAPFLDFFSTCSDDSAGTRPRIAQMMLEMHGTDFNPILSAFTAFDSCGMRIFHKERNHWGCDGYICVEFSMVDEIEARRGHWLAECPEVGFDAFLEEVRMLERIERSERTRREEALARDAVADEAAPKVRHTRKRKKIRRPTKDFEGPGDVDKA